MSNQEETMRKHKQEEEDDNVYDEEPSKDTITPRPNTVKSDIHAWRKRQSIAYLRNPLRRRMSQGEQLFKKKSVINILYPCSIRLSRYVCCSLFV